MRIFAGFPGEVVSNESVVVENGDFRFFRSLSWKHFTYMDIRSTAFTWCDCWRPWKYFKVIKLFHIKFLINGALYGKSYYKVLIGNHTLAFDWCHFWWPWSTFEGHFSLSCHFHVHFGNLWQAFASRGLPAIDDLLVIFWPNMSRSTCSYEFNAHRRRIRDSTVELSCVGVGGLYWALVLV